MLLNKGNETSMKKPLFALLVVLVLSLTAYASDCPTTTYDNYIVSGFSCGIQDQTYSEFTYSGTSNPPGFAIPAGSIAVTPLTTMGDPGFQWSAPWFASTSSGILAQDSLLQFNVNVNPGGAPITDLTLTIGGMGFQGTGAVVVDETACLGAVLPTCTGGSVVTLEVYDSSSGSKFSDTVNFAGVNEVSVDKDIELQAGTNGQATLSVVTDQFGGGSSTVPEPGTLSMLGIGAMAVFQFARRKIRR
jgi:hypothetical protein